MTGLMEEEEEEFKKKVAAVKCSSVITMIEMTKGTGGGYGGTHPHNHGVKPPLTHSYSVHCISIVSSYSVHCISIVSSYSVHCISIVLSYRVSIVLVLCYPI